MIEFIKELMEIIKKQWQEMTEFGSEEKCLSYQFQLDHLDSNNSSKVPLGYQDKTKSNKKAAVLLSPI